MPPLIPGVPPPPLPGPLGQFIALVLMALGVGGGFAYRHKQMHGRWPWER